MKDAGLFEIHFKLRAITDTFFSPFVCDSFQLGCKTLATSISSPDEAPDISIKKIRNLRRQNERGIGMEKLTDGEMMLVCNVISCVSFWPRDSCSLTRAVQFNEGRLNL